MQLHTCFFLTYSSVNRSIISQARTNIQNRINEIENTLDNQHTGNSPQVKGLPPSPVSAYSTNGHLNSVDLEGLIQSGNTLKVKGLRKDYNDPSSSTLALRLKADATKEEIMVAIKDAGAFLTILPMSSLHD